MAGPQGHTSRPRRQTGPVRTAPMPCRWPVPVVALLASLVAGGVASGEGKLSGLTATLDGIRGADARPHVVALADDSFEGREAGSRGGQGAGHYIAGVIAPLRLLPAGDGGGFFQRFGAMRNILALLPGSDPAVADELVVVGAHYDHVGYGAADPGNGAVGQVHNGADDNASGAAGLIEIATLLAELPRPPRRSILVAWWDGEEKGLLGSSHFLGVRPGRLAGLRPVFSLNLDMIGRLRAGRVEVFGSRSGIGLRSALSRANVRTGLELVFDWDLVDDSDHYPFIAGGIPTLMLHTGLHPEYHHPDDDAARIDSDGLATVTRLACALLLDVADAERAPPAFRPECRAESARSRELLETVQQASIGSPPRGRWQPWGIASRADPAEPDSPVVVTVADGSPLATAGIMARDRVVEIDGQPVGSHDDMLRRFREAGGQVDVVVERNGRRVSARARRQPAE
jgi:hypothetical protein